MTWWDSGSRASANECPCEPLEEHARPCNVKGPCYDCGQVADCSVACGACRRYLSLLKVLQQRSVTFAPAVEPETQSEAGPGAAAEAAPA